MKTSSGITDDSDGLSDLEHAEMKRDIINDNNINLLIFFNFCSEREI